MNREPCATNNIYHIYNRGVDKRKIFTADWDRIRFVRNLFEFNDKNPALHQIYKDAVYEVQPRIQLVEILAYCLMPNHYHLLVRQTTDNGVVMFMKKLGTGYTMYFNQKYERSGALFQGRFKSVLVENDVYSRYLPHYIHLNPLDLTMPSWRDGKVNKKEALRSLMEYKWTSLHDYIDRPRFPNIVTTDFINSLCQLNYKNNLLDYLNDLDLSNLEKTGLTLE